ncbi:MAG: hypothetical protein KAU14_05615, partial [Thermoplasmata archaeon]|nr:hypothetical protein [Thermoplasmata archaeon]
PLTSFGDTSAGEGIRRSLFTKALTTFGHPALGNQRFPHVSAKTTGNTSSNYTPSQAQGY